MNHSFNPTLLRMKKKYSLILASALFFALAGTAVASTYQVTDQVAAGLKNWRSITSSADGTHLAAVAASTGDVFTSGDTGVTWTDQTASGSRSWYAVNSSSDGSHLAAIVNGGDIYTSTTTGATWVDQTSSGARQWRGIASSADGSHLAAIVNGGHIFTSTTTGATWNDQATSGSRAWSSITSSSDGSLLAATVTGGDIYTSTTTGATWVDQTASGARQWTSITSSANGLILVASEYVGKLYKSTDGGATWAALTNSPTATWEGVSCSADCSHIVGVAYQGAVYSSSDSGTTWITETNFGTNKWFAVTSSSDGSHIAAVANTGDIYTGSNAITDVTPPTISITTPTNGSTISGSSVSVSATAQDNISVIGVSFYVDGVHSIDVSPAPYAFSLDTTGYVNGTHSLSAVAVDGAGNRATTTLSSLIINNAPNINLTSVSAARTTASVVWTTGSGATSQVNYGITSNYGSSSPLDSSLVTTHSVVLTGLVASTTYHFQISSANSGGTSTTTDSTFTTGSISGTAPTVTTSSATSITGVSANLNATLTSDGTASTTIYGFNYGLTTGYGSTVSFAVPLALGAYQIAASNLASGKTYHYQAFATNNAGTGTSTDATFITLAPSVITAIATSSDSTSATISWTTDLPNTSSVSYGPSASYGISVTSPSLTTSHTVVITGLTPQTTYHFQVGGLTAGGLQTLSADNTVTTAAIPVVVVVPPTPVSSSGGGGGGGGGGASSFSTASMTNKVLTCKLVPTNGSIKKVCTITDGSATTATGSTAAAGAGSTGPGTVAAGGKGSFTKALAQGSRLTEVKLLQQYLNTHGFTISTNGVGSLGKETTYYGKATTNAVKRLQIAAGITPANGKVGPKTRAYLNTHP
jgi:hypothetical protein